MAASPAPKWCCQIRLASTRARSAAGREPGLVSQRARASRRPVEPEPANGGFGSYRLSGSVKKAGTPGPTLGPGVARLPRIEERDLGRVARDVADPGDPAGVGPPLGVRPPRSPV